MVVPFGLGFSVSVAVGAIALLPLLGLIPGGSTPGDARGFPGSLAALDHWTSAPTPARQAAASETSQPEAFDMRINRNERARAPFSLRLTGMADVDGEVVLRNLPATASLSHGVRQDNSTWAVRTAHLGDLHLTVSEGTPDAFDLWIDVVAPPYVAATASVARVRVVDGAGEGRLAETTAVGRAEPIAKAVANGGLIDLARTTWQQATSTRRATGAGSEKVTTRAPAQRATPPAETVRPSQAAAPARHWPEGASALGAASRDTDRQVWWKMPPPAWSPFQDQSGQR